MIGVYYFWKWADNDLSGKPPEVHAMLLRGEMHPALQTFDARPLLNLLSKRAAKGRQSGEEWNWKVHPKSSPDEASFVFVTCPEIEKFDGANWDLINQLCALDLSGFDENHGRLIEFLLPKLNGFELGQYPDLEYSDITAEDLPVLLKQIRTSEPDATATLTDWRNHFVQCAAFGGRFTLDWRQNHDIKDLGRFDHWLVGYPADIETRQGRRVRRKFIPAGMANTRWIDGGWKEEFTKEKEYELIYFSDVVWIFESFLEGKGPPSDYTWRDIKNLGR